MTLNPQVVTLIEKMKEANIQPTFTMSPTDARNQMDEMAKVRDKERTQVLSIEDFDIPGPASNISIRLYRPLEANAKELPIRVYFHGGGHVIGSLDSHDEVVRAFCSGTNCIMASVDYRLAPEHKFPAAIDDSYAAVEWLFDNCEKLGADKNKFIVGGDSAGANIAAVMAIMSRDNGGPRILSQQLIYPVVDYACEGGSYDKFANGYGPLTKEGMLWFQNHYLRSNEDKNDWRASPIKASNLSGLPHTAIITAEYDVLHDEGVVFAKSLMSSGVSVEHTDWPGMIHGFVSLAPYLDDGKAAITYICNRINKLL